MVAPQAENRILPDVVVLEEVPGDSRGYLVGREQLRFGGFDAVQVLGRHHHISFGRRRRR